MRWRTGRRSENVEDQCDAGGGLGDPFGGEPAPLRVGRTIGIGGGLDGVVLVVALLLMSVGPSFLLTSGDQVTLGQFPARRGPGADEAPQFQAPTAGVEDEMQQFVSVVLADTEDTWTAVFKESGKRYTNSHLVLFRGMARFACKLGEAAMGPFYCPADQ